MINRLLVVTFCSCLAALGISGCTMTTAGTGEVPGRGAQTVPGVQRTATDTMPATAMACSSPIDASGEPLFVSTSGAPGPRAMLTLPTGWSAAVGPDGEMTLAGPSGMTGSAKIVEAADSPAAVFTAYADRLNAAGATSVKVEAAPLCDYSGQRISGSMGGQAFVDRIAHVWTDSGDYLVSIHVQGPADKPGFADAAASLTADFPVFLP